MESILIRDVGDGSDILIANQERWDLMIDFGGEKNMEPYFPSPKSFVLSHFHEDHYNGFLLFYDGHFRPRHYYPYWNLSNVYYPIMPSFADSKLFYNCLLAMNMRLNPMHPIQTSLMGLLSKISTGKITFQSLGQGDWFLCNGKHYEVLWPPQQITDEEILKSIKTAINDFRVAKKHDSILSDLYDRASQIRFDSDNLNMEAGPEWSVRKPNIAPPNDYINRANTSLRSAANRLSLAFKQADNLLFLGDLEQREINFVCADLEKQETISFEILISAHHGTHWGKNLSNFQSRICVASVGGLYKHLKSEYRQISQRFINTRDWGHIHIKRKLKVT